VSWPGPAQFCHWLPVAGPADQGLALVTFDSEEAAQGLADFLKSAPEEAGVTLDREGIWVGEVLAHV